MSRLTDLEPEQALAEGFARHMVALAKQLGAPDRSLGVLHRAAHAVSSATQAGHACIYLESIRPLTDLVDMDTVRIALQQTGLVTLADAEKLEPLVLDSENRLYLARYFDYERRLASRLARLAASAFEPPTKIALATLERLFAGKRDHAKNCADWQKIAVTSALGNRLTIIAGGPGTGKTTTVISLLGCLLVQQPNLRIALAAPTGKAAQRMQESMRERIHLLPEALHPHLPLETHTVHRLLGVLPESHRFRHHVSNPLAVDVLVVDEASMLDLALATKLVEALPEHAKLILLGDKDQLAAVEAGAVFSEISADPSLDETCRHRLAEHSGIAATLIEPEPAKQTSPLRNCTFWLGENMRFGKESGIARLAEGINAGLPEPAIEVLRDTSVADIQWFEDGSPTLQNHIIDALFAGYRWYVESLRKGSECTETVFSAFETYRILAAVRDSERGVEALNHELERRFRERLTSPSDDGQTPWYPGRPVILQRNDYSLKLFNGDVGIALPDKEGHLRVYFPAPERQLRALSPAQLPAHETAFVMSVHKSQGSEFDHVALVLPAFPSRVLSRELIYTAITRARRQVTLVGTESLLRQSIETPTVRHSGLISRLREACDAPRAGAHGS